MVANSVRQPRPFYKIHDLLPKEASHKIRLWLANPFQRRYLKIMVIHTWHVLLKPDNNTIKNM